MVKCADCGYLSVRNKRDNHLSEAINDFREKGAVAQGYDEIGHNPHQLHEIAPICFVRSYNLINECKPEISPQKVSQVLNNDRPCKEFMKWQQGFTPKEHREMIDRQKLLEYQSQQRKEDKHWRIIELIVLGGIATLVAGGFTLLGAWISRG